MNGSPRDFSVSTSHFQSKQWIQGCVCKQQLPGASRAAEWEQWKEPQSGQTHKCPVSSWIWTGLFKVLQRCWTSDPQFNSFSLEIQTFQRLCILLSLLLPDLPQYPTPTPTHSNLTQHPILWAIRLALVSRASGCRGEHVFLGDYCLPFWLTSPDSFLSRPFLITRNIFNHSQLCI